MQLRLVLLLLLAHAGLSPAQTEAPKAPAAEGAKPSPAEGDFGRLISEAQQLSFAQRFFEALDRLHQAEKLKPDHPTVHNVRGSVHTGMRDFEKARESFTKAQALNPAAFEPKFNLTELDYVTGDYAKAEAGFTKLLSEFPKLPLEVRHLTQFKVLVCQLKQKKIAEAETGMKSFTFMDDTAAYYYCKAAFSFQKGDKADATEWVAKAQRIFKQVENAPYLDSLMEARWIASLTVPDDPKK